MAKLEKGRLFLRLATHTMLFGMKKIPIAGDILELAQGCYKIIRDEQNKANVHERLTRIEEAAALSAQEARLIATEVIEEQRRAGEFIEADKAEAITECLMFMPATIKERTAVTLRQARKHNTALDTVLPITAQFTELEQDIFYQSLFPARRPRFRVGDAVPHGNPSWQLAEFLGAGGFGEVWQVKHQRLCFAIKFCLDAASAQVLKREADALFSLREKLPEHPNIVRLVDLNLSVEPYWLAFDFIEGGTLESLLRATPLTVEECLKLFRPIVEAVAAVHKIGIIHRDLKPANILLTQQGVVKIADFGIGKVVVENAAVMNATRTQFTTQSFGSMGYMSPEQSNGLAAHPSDDTYALGILLWQMLTQNLKTPTFQELMAVQKLDVPIILQNIIMECLGKSRDERPQNGSAVLAMLSSSQVPELDFANNDAPISENETIAPIIPTPGSYPEKPDFKAIFIPERDTFELPQEFAARYQNYINQFNLAVSQHQMAYKAGIARLNKSGYDIHSGHFPLEVKLENWAQNFLLRPENHIQVARDDARNLWEEGAEKPVFYLLKSVDNNPQIEQAFLVGLGKRWKLAVSNLIRHMLKDGSFGPQLIIVPAGKFMMGSNDYDGEKPIHEVTIAQPFAIGKYPVTFEEYDKYCDATGVKKPEDSGWGRGKRPVINISWNDAQKYCQWLSKQTGQHYRLPTEAEWEYACRAGSTTKWCCGDDESELENYAWYDANSGGQTHPVGEKKPNKFGLYDMHGNVWEWCEDSWHDNYEGAPTDGSAWKNSNENRSLLRGGSWYSNASNCRSAGRGRYNRGNRVSNRGVRLVCSVRA